MTAEDVTGQIVRKLETAGSGRSRAFLEIISRAVNDPETIRWDQLRAYTRVLPDTCRGDEKILAIETCGFLLDHEAVTCLSGLVDHADPEVYRAAVVALGRIGGADACQTLLELVGSSDDARLATALRALQSMGTEKLSRNLARSRHFVLALSDPVTLSTETMNEFRDWVVEESRTSQHLSGFHRLLTSLHQHNHALGSYAIEIRELMGDRETEGHSEADTQLSDESDQTRHESVGGTFPVVRSGKNDDQASEFVSSANDYSQAAMKLKLSGELPEAASYYERAGDLFSQGHGRNRSGTSYWQANTLYRQLSDISSVERVIDKTQPFRQGYLEQLYSSDENIDCLIKDMLRQGSRLWEIESEELPSLLFPEKFRELFDRFPALGHAIAENGTDCVRAMQVFLPEALADGYELYLRLFGFLVTEFNVGKCLEQLFQQGHMRPDLWPIYRRHICSDIPEGIAYETLMRYLSSGQSEQRAFAAAMTVSMDAYSTPTAHVSYPAQEKLLDVMADLLDDLSPNVRCYSALAMGCLGDPRAGRCLLELLDDETVLPDSKGVGDDIFHYVCCKAAELLAKNLDYRGFRPLIRCLSSPNLALRFAAVIALEYYRDVAVVPHLIESYKRSCLDTELAGRLQLPTGFTEDGELLPPGEFQKAQELYQESLLDPRVRGEHTKKSLRLKILSILETFDDEQAKAFVDVNKDGEE